MVGAANRHGYLDEDLVQACMGFWFLLGLGFLSALTGLFLLWVVRCIIDALSLLW